MLVLVRQVLGLLQLRPLRLSDAHVVDLRDQAGPELIWEPINRKQNHDFWRVHLFVDIPTCFFVQPFAVDLS